MVDLAIVCGAVDSCDSCNEGGSVKYRSHSTGEALLGVIGIRDIWVKNYRDTGYLGGKLKGYGIFLKRFWDIEVIIF